MLAMGWIAAWAACVFAATTTDSAAVVGGVSVSGPGAERMRPSISKLQFRAFDSATVRRSLSDAVDTVVAQGFLAASATATQAVATDSGTTIFVQTEAGGRLVWENLVDIGTGSLTAEALRRLGRIPSGRPADPADLESAMRRLAQTGYVESTAPPSIRRLPRSARARAQLTLRDLPSSWIEAAAGWSRGEDAKGYVDARLANMAGTARDLEFGISQGEQGTRAHTLWKEPWLGEFDVRLVLQGNLANDTLAQTFAGSLDLVWTLLDGRLEAGGGLAAAVRAERAPGDSLFGARTREYGTRASVSWRRKPASAWPIDDVSARVDAEAVGTESDTGTGARLRAEGSIDTWKGLGSFVVRLGTRGRGVWPLDRTAGLSEALAPGGIAGWRGWPEGSPRSPAWAWLVAQAGIGNPENGGVFVFCEPGARALRRQDLTWKPDWGWSAGSGVAFSLPAWQIDLVIAGRDDTPSWQDALLQVRARNRF